MTTIEAGDSSVWQGVLVTSFSELGDLERTAGGSFGTTYSATHQRLGRVTYKKLRGDNFIGINDRSVPLASSSLRLGSVVVGRRTVIQRSRVRLPAGALPDSLGQLSLSSPGVDKSSTGLLAGVKAGRVYLCRLAGSTV